MIQTIYDIINLHGGDLTVETKEGEGLPAGEAGSEFTIKLPIVQIALQPDVRDEYIVVI